MTSATQAKATETAVKIMSSREAAPAWVRSLVAPVNK
jgi:hypothetical protein